MKRSPLTPMALTIVTVGVAIIFLGFYFREQAMPGVEPIRHDDVQGALIERIVNVSKMRCLGFISGRENPDIFADALQAVQTDALKVLAANNIIICMDSTLNEVPNHAQLAGTEWEDIMGGIKGVIHTAYYTNEKVLTLRAPAHDYDGREIIRSAEDDHIYRLVEKLAQQLDAGYMDDGKLYLGVRKQRGERLDALYIQYKDFEPVEILPNDILTVPVNAVQVIPRD